VPIPMKYISFFVFVFLSTLLHSQTTHQYTDSTGNFYWNKTAPLYLFVSNSPDGKENKRLISQKSAKYSNPVFLDTEGVNFIRTRNAVDPETKKVLEGVEVLFEIYADGTAPETMVKYEGAIKHETEGVVYFKSGLGVTLSSQDALSGTKRIRYAINNKDFTTYESLLLFDEQGKFSLTYFSEDNVGNVEQEKTLRFEIDNEPSYSDLTINGITEKDVISLDSKMYILALDSMSGVGSVFYKFDNEPFVVYKSNGIPFSHLGEGPHSITYYSVDNVKNQEEEKTFEFYLDKSPPLMVADVLGDRFIVNDQVYFSGRTKLKLTAVDNKVGVKNIMVSIDGGEFEKYDQPIYLPSVSGLHSIRYYSVDNLDNSTISATKSSYVGRGGFEEYKHNVNKVYVDLTGPVINFRVLNHQFTRGDTLFIGPYSEIKFDGTDGESGFNNITYSLNDEIAENKYSEPITLKVRGYNTLNYYGYDNVNNRNVSKFSFFLDDEKPKIYVQFSFGSIAKAEDGLLVYPENVGVFLSATDKVSGIRQFTYQLDDMPEKAYAGQISGLKKGKHTLTVTAYDFLNNRDTQQLTFYIQ